MEARVSRRNYFENQAAVENKVSEKGRLNIGAFVSFVSVLLASISLAVVGTPAAVGAYLVLAIVSAFSFEFFVDREIRNAEKKELSE
ncbi:MAG: hypothetical protein ACOYJH_01155 [Anaerovoracaceae bacterium]|jgi:hypothetical protein